MNYNNVNQFYEIALDLGVDYIHITAIENWTIKTQSSYKNYSGNKNLTCYKSAYLCTLKKIKETIEFLNKSDPNSIVVFQSDHNWVMSKNKQEKKMIFNLIKISDDCRVASNINFNNVNALRLILSCITGSSLDYINK